MLKNIPRRISLALLLLFSFATQAQTNWTIGSGTASNTFGSGANPYPCPFGNYYSGMRAQYIYRATELTAAGMTAGLIHKLAWNVTNVGSSGAHLNYTISIKGITATSLTSWQTGTTQVYSASSYQPVSGWNTFTLSSPFSWNGTDNIVVEVCFWNGTLTYTDNARVQLTASLGANTSIDYYDDFGGPYCGQNSLSQNSYPRRPNIRFTRLAACSGVPAAGTVTAPASICPGVAFNLSATGTTNAGNITYQWQSSPTPTGGFSNITGATTAAYSVAGGISAPTSYRLVVTCTSSSQSDTSNVVTVNLTNFQNCFCTPTYVDGCEYGDDINTITLTGALSTGINQVNNPCPGLNAYTNYTSLSPTKMAAGTTYNGTISTDYSDEGVKFWIDFNNNGMFESSEMLTNFDGVAEAPLTSPYSLPIPASAPYGVHRMRVRLVYYDPVAADIDPCAEYDYGETRDYNVRIIPHAPSITPSATTVCAGQSFTLTAVPFGTVTSPVYLWTGPGGYTATGVTQTFNNVTTSQAGTYTVRVVVGSDTSEAANVVMTINPKPAALTIGSNSPVCAGATLNLVSGSTSTGVAYAWTGPNAFNSASQNPSITNVTAAAGGIYKVTASLNGCTDTAVTTVTVNPSPASVTAANNGPVCAGNTLNLTGSSTTTGVSYSWAGPNSFSSALQNPGITSATTAASGTYTLTATLGSCTTTATTAAVVNPVPAGVTAASNSPVCAGSALNLTGSSTTTGVSYSWAGPNSFSATTQNTTIPNVTAAAAGIYTLTASVGSCTATATTSVAVKPTPAGVTASGNSPICAGSTLNLSGNSTTSGVSYSWTGPGSFNSGLQNPSITNATTAASGVYTLTASLNGCSRTATTNVIVHANPVAIANANGSTSICQGDFVTLQANAGAGLSYQWKRNGGNVGTGISYNASVAGNYTVTVTNANGCTTTSAPPIAVTVVPLPPSTVTYNTSLSFCEGQSVTLHAPTGTGYTYTWYQDGNPIPGATTDVYTATIQGVYSLRVTAGSGCTSLSSPVSVTVFPVLTPIISRSGNVLSSSGYIAYQWYFNNNPIPGGTAPDITITQNGYYQVLGTDANGCTSTSAIAWIQNLGIDGHVKADEINIFPNPATTEIHVQSPVKVNVVIRNLQGQAVLSGKAVTVLNISSLANGVYMISVYDSHDALLKTGRLIKSE